MARKNKGLMRTVPRSAAQTSHQKISSVKKDRNDHGKTKGPDRLGSLRRQIADLGRLASFPQLNSNPVLEVNLRGKIIFINDAAKKALGKVRPKSRGEVFLPSDIEEILADVRKGKGRMWYREVDVRGTVFEEWLYYTPEFRAIRIYAHDITARKKMESDILQVEQFLTRERDFVSAVLSTAGALVVVLDRKGRIVKFNKECERTTGYTFGEVEGKLVWDIFLLPEEVRRVRRVFRHLLAGKFPTSHENHWVAKDGTSRLIAWKDTVLLDGNGKVEFVIGTGIDVTDRRRAEEELRVALRESQQRQKEVAVLLDASSAVLQRRSYAEAAKAIFGACKGIVGATCGYIALVSDDGSANEIVYLDAGAMECTVDPSLPMPVRGMRGEVFSTGRALRHNNFPGSAWAHLMPDGHVRLDNVIMAPMTVENKVVGLFGLGNKPGGFTDNDVRITTAFCDIAAIALL